jgi:hypothetical protein
LKKDNEVRGWEKCGQDCAKNHQKTVQNEKSPLPGGVFCRQRGDAELKIAKQLFGGPNTPGDTLRRRPGSDPRKSDFLSTHLSPLFRHPESFTAREL